MPNHRIHAPTVIFVPTDVHYPGATAPGSPAAHVTSGAGSDLLDVRNDGRAGASPSPSLRGAAPRRRGHRVARMCRNITTLRGLQPVATPEEIEAAARQYVRKVSGVQSTSPQTEEAFESAVTGDQGDGELLAGLPPRRQPPPTLPPLRRIAAKASGGGGSRGETRRGSRGARGG